MAVQFSQQRLEELLRETFELAKLSVMHGNQPFGALLAHKTTGKILHTSENTELTGDMRGHAETNLVSSAKLSAEEFAECVLVCSTEPCMMCCGAANNKKITHIIFGCSADKMSEIISGVPSTYHYSCKNILQFSKRTITIDGPLLEKEAQLVHLNYWSKSHKKQ